MDDLTFDFESTDVAAGQARFPHRPLKAGGRRHVTDAGVVVREGGSDFARHAWDESGYL